MRKCEFNNCPNKHRALGLCAMHLKRYRRYGDPNLTKVKTWVDVEETTSYKWRYNRWREESIRRMNLEAARAE